MGPSPLPKRGKAPKFLAHVYCGQTAAWIKMLFGTEVGFSLCNNVLDGDLNLTQIITSIHAHNDSGIGYHRCHTCMSYVLFAQSYS